MNSSIQNKAMPQLNAAVATIYKAITAIMDAEAVFEFETDVSDPSVAKGQFVEIVVWKHFGDLDFGSTHRIVCPTGACPGGNFLVQLPCFVLLPRVLKNIFAKYAQHALFDVPFARLGLALELSVYWSSDDHEYVPLNSAMKHVTLNAFTESYFRHQAQDLVAELAPYLNWLQYFEYLASGEMECERRQWLIADANKILAYLYEGGTLNFVKLSSLCDVAGSLQPVRNLIEKNMPNLAV